MLFAVESQSQTGGFQKPRDVVNTSYYARLMSEKDLTAEQLYQLRKAEKEREAAAAAATTTSETENDDIKERKQKMQVMHISPLP